MTKPEPPREPEDVWGTAQTPWRNAQPPPQQPGQPQPPPGFRQPQQPLQPPPGFRPAPPKQSQISQPLIIGGIVVGVWVLLFLLFAIIGALSGY